MKKKGTNDIKNTYIQIWQRVKSWWFEVTANPCHKNLIKVVCGSPSQTKIKDRNSGQGMTIARKRKEFWQLQKVSKETGTGAEITLLEQSTRAFPHFQSLSQSKVQSVCCVKEKSWRKMRVIKMKYEETKITIIWILFQTLLLFPMQSLT